MNKLPNRRPCVTSDLGLGLSVTVSYNPKTDEACEVDNPFLKNEVQAAQ